jgi:gluconate kinase
MDGALSCDVPAGDGWLPVWAGWREGTLQVEWCHFGAEPLHEPFFQDSVMRVMRRPVNQLLRHRTPIQALGSRLATRPDLPPRGFVFHASRCGSTLVAQLLAAMRGSVVLSEAPPMDAVLSATGDDGAAVPEAERAEWLSWMLAALAQPRAPGDRQLFVKFDAWHARHLPLIRHAFPDVPWVFLYRDPREILASQLRQAGAFLVPGALERVGGPSAAEAPPGDTLGARIAGLVCRTFEAARDALPGGGGLLVNYAALPEAFADIVAHFGLEPEPGDLEAIHDRAQQDAKSPGLPYERRSDSLAAADPVALAIVETHALAAYQELERARIAPRG